MDLEEANHKSKSKPIFKGSLFEWLSFLAAVITPLQNAPALVRFFKIVENAQQTIASLDIVQPETPTRLVQYLYISLCGVLPVILASIAEAPYRTFYYISSLCIMATIDCATLIKIKMMLLLLDSKFEVLNDKFKEVSDETMGIVPKAEFDINDFIMKLQNTKYVKPKIGGAGISVDKILKFNKAHFQLCDAHVTINTMFSTTAVVLALNVSYTFLKGFIFPNYEDSVLVVLVYYFVGFLTMFLFITMLTSATNVKNNAMKTGFLIHELLNEDLPPDVEEELQLFSHILIHRKIALSAEGFFTIDLKLLTKIACTLAPLILIMVQRKNRPKKA